MGRAGDAMKIVRASAADAHLVAPLLDRYRVFYKQAPDLSAAEAYLSKLLVRGESVVFMAVVGEKAAGFTQLFPSFSTVSLQRVFILNDLFVSPERRKMGIGKALLSAAQQYCIDQGGKGLALETATDNPAQQLYSEMGWVKDTHCFHYFWSAPQQINPNQEQV